MGWFKEEMDPGAPQEPHGTEPPKAQESEAERLLRQILADEEGRQRLIQALREQNPDLKPQEPRGSFLDDTIRSDPEPQDKSGE